VDGRSRLVPQQAPRSALICAYADSNLAKQQAGWALSGRRSLTGNLAGLAAQLSWQSRRVPGQQIFYAGVGGGQCVTASNGEFTSSGTIGPVVTRAFASGRWPAPQAVSCNGTFQDIGRLGQDTTMVPAGSTSLTICAAKTHITVTSGYQTLVRTLNRLPARVSTRSCSGSPGPGSFYQLLFSYPEGPLVAVDIAVGCHPEIDNLDRQSASASSVLPLVQQLLKAR
jgi:hypothetical protein